LKKAIYILLFPFSFIYGLLLYLRNKFYDWNLFKTTSFDFPIISVGNLNLGGVGKTPHVEYLIRLLNKNYKIATLSRGYKRNTSGFFLSNNNSTVAEIGDEPLQYKLKFKNILVAVDEKRVNGIKKIKEIHSETHVILLDDAFQHRAVNPGVNILITESNQLYVNDYVVPSGRLREWSYGSKRAGIIIVSKTSDTLSLDEKKRMIEELNPLPHQKIYFSYIKYGEMTPFTNIAHNVIKEIGKNFSILLLTGIAKSESLLNELKTQFSSIEHLKFSDHHNFTDSDIADIKTRFKNLYGNNKIIITTEKDIMRLSLPKTLEQLQDIPIFYIPIEICFHGNDKEEFDKQILEYVTTNSGN
jgi:tetraacyldisaccharide 4'-kinase